MRDERAERSADERRRAAPKALAPQCAARRFSHEREGWAPMTFTDRALRHVSFVVGGVLVSLLAVVAVLSLFWTPHPANEIDVPSKLQGPSWSHWLGTDSLGRDIVSQLLVGAQNSIAVGVIAVGIGMGVGVSLGLLAAARRGWVEELVMRLADFTFAFPALVT